MKIKNLVNSYEKMIDIFQKQEYYYWETINYWKKILVNRIFHYKSKTNALIHKYQKIKPFFAIPVLYNIEIKNIIRQI